MTSKREGALEAALEGAGIRMAPEAFVKAVGESARCQRASLHGPSSRELSAAEAAAYEAGGFDLKPRKRRKPGPLDQAFIDFIALQSECHNVRQVADFMGIDPSRVRQRLAARSIYGFRREGEWLLPDFQFHAKRPLPGLEKVVPEIDPEMHPLSVYRFFITPQRDLVVGDDKGEAVTPRDWLLLEMDPRPVAELARDLSQI